MVHPFACLIVFVCFLFFFHADNTILLFIAIIRFVYLFRANVAYYKMVGMKIVT